MTLFSNPKHRMPDDEARAALASFHRLAILVTPDLRITHLPILLEGNAVVGHVAKANTIWQSTPCDAVIVCPGPEAYVSPNWYPSKAEHHRAVPTWNYVTVHVHGVLSAFHDAQRLEHLVAALSEDHERRHASAWRLSDAPRDYIDRLINGIVGVSLDIKTIEGKAKLSQDKSDADQTSVRDALLASPDPRDHAIGILMRNHTP